MRINHYTKHIDNGGITIGIEQTEDSELIVEIMTSYFGYPYLVTQLRGLDITAKDLEDIGLMFINAAHKIFQNQKKD